MDVRQMCLNPVEIKLNVYDLSQQLNENMFVRSLGLGAFHSAVEFYGREVKQFSPIYGGNSLSFFCSMLMDSPIMILLDPESGPHILMVPPASSIVCP